MPKVISPNPDKEKAQLLKDIGRIASALESMNKRQLKFERVTVELSRFGLSKSNLDAATKKTLQKLLVILDSE